uniref:Receptor kinase-like protein Xa21 n=1 Tax=Oryza nivara TaxID=4536 RepID=A0A0E0FGC7_ORYNI
MRLVLLSFILAVGAANAGGSSSDEAALLAFKARISEHRSLALASWNSSNSLCNWEGVTCSRRRPTRVVALSLPSSNLTGTLPEVIGNLTFLQRLNLSSNGLNGEIPPSLGRLRRLRILDLGSNSFSGAFPINLSSCISLTNLSLAYNQLAGRIPVELGNTLIRLEKLALENNTFTGPIPASLNNISSLGYLNMDYNYLEDQIPPSLGNIPALHQLSLAENSLSGEFPPSLWNLSKLTVLEVFSNMLQGSIPANIGDSFPDITYFGVADNRFSGVIPPSLFNLSSLTAMYLSGNRFRGFVPPTVGRMQSLVYLHLHDNRLEANNRKGWEFITSLANCSRLQELVLSNNSFRGQLPNSIVNLSTTFQRLYLGECSISGSIPQDIGNLVGLEILYLAFTSLSGAIPTSIGKLANLVEIGLYNTSLSGFIPSSFGNLTSLNRLYAYYTSLEGPIPPSLGKLKELFVLDLSTNRHNGSIPKEILELPSLSWYLDLSYNSLSGPLPLEVGTLANLNQLILSGNQLSGQIPDSIGNCEVLEFLQLDKNSFEGGIPQSLTNLKGLNLLNLTMNKLSGRIPETIGRMGNLQQLCLAHNNFSGPIPATLQNLTMLWKLDVAFNNLQGEVPDGGVFKNLSSALVAGNDKLCGGIPQLHLAPCPILDASKNKKRWPKSLIIALPTTGSIFLLLSATVLIVLVCRKCKQRPNSQATSPGTDEHYHRVSYYALARGSNGFSKDNLLGKGSYGSVYRCTLEDEVAIVAVKVFNLQQSGSAKSFEVECEALRRVRHRCLTKIITCCSSINPQGQEFKALIFEYMPNGSLDGWLHPTSSNRTPSNTLSLLQRLSIAVDILDALDYLHNHCQPPIIHCDLKPSNILLAEDMSAKVGDFGISRILPENIAKTLQNSISIVGIRGSIGYIPPEYGEGSEVSRLGDIYSLGILLLEIFTGRSPTDDMFKDSVDLHKIASAAFPDLVLEIVDRTIWLHEEAKSKDITDASITRSIVQDSLVSVLRLGISCSKQQAKERMLLADAVSKMHAIRDEYILSQVSTLFFPFFRPAFFPSPLPFSPLPAGRRFSALGFFPAGAFSAFSAAGSSSAGFFAAGFFSALGAMDAALFFSANGTKERNHMRLLVLLSLISVLTIAGGSTDEATLLAFKAGLSSRTLTSWNSSTSFCNWEGVKCSRHRPTRVVGLSLPSSNLAGTLPPAIGNLTFLRWLNLSSNGLHGEIPPSLGRLQHLRILDLGSNSVSGAFPDNLSSCISLINLTLGYNQLSGHIPVKLGNTLTRLQKLHLGNNSFTGPIPASLANLSSLEFLKLDFNHLKGLIPSSLGNIPNLQKIGLDGNRLSGEFPPSIWNLSKLTVLQVYENKLKGSIPANIGDKLPNMQHFVLSVNQFSGVIPSSLFNLSSLTDVYLDGNKFSGFVPPTVGRLKSLVRLSLSSNRLEANNMKGWEFITSLANCSQLQQLDIAENSFIGQLPISIVNLSTTLQKFFLRGNSVSGRIPTDIGNLIGLDTLDLGSTSLSGVIPESIGKLADLAIITLYSTRLSGLIPSVIGNLTNLNILAAYDAHLEGPIPATLGKLKKLFALDLSINHLNGSVPKEIFELPSLSWFLILSDNTLSGPIPSEVGTLVNLNSTELSGNQLSGQIPDSIGNCEVLEYLLLDSNSFEGGIPQSLTKLKGLTILNLTMNKFSGSIPDAIGSMGNLQQLCLAHNNLSGSIPETLQNLTQLWHLDVSFNNLQGKVPEEGAFRNLTYASVAGNDKLCGGIPRLHLAPCPIPAVRKDRKERMKYLKVAFITTGAILVLASAIVLIMLQHRKLKGRQNSQEISPVIEEQYQRISYYALSRGSNEFSEANLLGKGRYGSVYKCTLQDEGEPVAVKVFDLKQLGSSRSFQAECEALRRVRHHCLTKIITCCSSIDPQGQEFKALVFEYMPNGSLDGWLHPTSSNPTPSNTLSLSQRFSIVVDILDALDYLHNSCQPPIIHCDLKPSNILLAEDMSAKVGDFGISKILPKSTTRTLQYSKSSIGIRGSIGYIAPEYGEGSAVTRAGDTYSLGILLLEMFTGRSPTDDIFRDSMDLHKFVAASFLESAMNIADRTIWLHEEANDTDGTNASTKRRIIQQCLVSVLRLGLSCSKQQPRDRMLLPDAASEIHAIRDEYLRSWMVENEQSTLN